MRYWELKVWDGHTNRSQVIGADTYGLAALRTDCYPPSYIWSIVEINT